METGEGAMKEDVNDWAKNKDREPLEEGEKNWKRSGKRNKGKGEGQVVRSYGRRTEQRGAENRPERMDKWILGVGTNTRRTGTGWARTERVDLGACKWEFEREWGTEFLERLWVSLGSSMRIQEQGYSGVFVQEYLARKHMLAPFFPG